MTTDRKPLLSCPFCGTDPTLEETGDYGVGFWVGTPRYLYRIAEIRCSLCEFIHVYERTEVKLHESEEQARDFVYANAAHRWNRRSTKHNPELPLPVFPISKRPEDGQFIFYWFEPFGTWHTGRYNKKSDSVHGHSGFTTVIPEVPFWMPEFEPRETPNAINDVTLYRELLACAYQLAGMVGAPVTWLDALSNGAEGKLDREVLDRLLPITPDQLDPQSFDSSPQKDIS